MTRYRGKVSRLYSRADVAFAMPGVYEYPETEGIKHAIRLPANRVLLERIGYLLKLWCPSIPKFAPGARFKVKRTSESGH